MTHEPVPSEPLGVAELTVKLAEAVETLRAIRNGEVDALVVADGSPGEQIFTLTTADRPYRSFVETMRDGAATVSESGIVLYANRSLAEILDLPLSGILGAPLSSFVVAGDQAALADQHDRAGTGSTIEIELTGNGGLTVPVRVAASTLVVDLERLVCLTFADLTQPRRDQEELSLAHEKAVEVSRLKSEFVANMSHEIRTPLNGVTGMTSLLLDTPLTDEQREYVDAVRESTDVLMAIINEILDFSKIEAGKLELDETTFALTDLVEGACVAVAAPAHAKGVELLSWIDDDVPVSVHGDANRIRQVLTNLLTNAVKFTSAGQVAAQLTARAEGSLWRIRFEVKDTGIGVTAGAADRIFDSFAQADGSTTRKYGGTGLGLTISKKLVELMGGDIGVVSAGDDGSVFWFTALVGAAPDSDAVDAGSVLEAVRVLAVDDNATSLHQLSRYCAGWGMEFEPAASGSEALERLAAAAAAGTPQEIVLVDSTMPGMSGRELVDAIRASSFASDLPIVMLVSSQSGRESDRDAGVDGFATKPIRPTRLRDEIARVLAEKAGAGSPKATSGSKGSASSLVEGQRVFDGRTVLLAEDNEINQRVLVRILELHGLHVDVAANGRLALEMHERSRYAAIFMDCQMPEVDGFEATAEIRRREGRRRVPIIAMTANTMSGDRQRCLDAGMDDYVGKPMSREALDAAIVRWLGPAPPRPVPGTTTDVDAAMRGRMPAARMPLFDRRILDDICANDIGVRRDLAALFADTASTSIANIGQAIDDADGAALDRAAHSLKGASASLGALRVARLADRLCEIGLTGDLADAAILLAELVEATDQTKAAWPSELSDDEPFDGSSVDISGGAAA